VDWHEAILAKLGPTNPKDAVVEIDVAAIEMRDLTGP
jgi:hypothetical protein